MQKLKAKVENLRNENDFKYNDENEDESLNLKNIKLRSYQKDGIKWLIERYEMDIGCILADEMGLGQNMPKRLAYALNVISKSNNSKILILSPLSVLNNWAQELDKYAPTLKYLAYIGEKEDKK